MSTIQKGQILWMIIRIEYFGVFKEEHPYLVLDVDENSHFVELGQLHSLQGKEYESIRESNVTIFCSNPEETVLPADSFMQMDNIIKIEYYDELKRFRRKQETLSENKFNRALQKYREYQKNHEIQDDHIVFLSKDDLIKLNS